MNTLRSEATPLAPLVLVHIDADELDRAAAFYARAFGLLVGRRTGPGVVELLGAGTPIHLLAQAGPPRGRPPVQVDLVVDDLEAARERARLAGARLEGGLREHAWGRVAQMTDPFGNRLCLLQFRRRGLEEPAAPWNPGRDVPAPAKPRYLQREAAP